MSTPRKSEEKIPIFGNKQKLGPLENYDQGLIEDEDPTELLKNGPIEGYSRWNSKNGSEWKECQVLDYFPHDKTFLIEWIHNNQKKRVSFCFFE